MLSLFAGNKYNTPSIEVSYFNNSAMRIQLWELNSYGAFNFLQLSTFFNLTNQIHPCLRKTWDFSNKFYNKSNISLNLKYSFASTLSCTLYSWFLKRKIHCVKSVQIRSFFWSVFSCLRTEYRDLRSKSPYSVRIQENTDQRKLRILTLQAEVRICGYRNL